MTHGVRGEFNHGVHKECTEDTEIETREKKEL